MFHSLISVGGRFNHDDDKIYDLGILLEAAREEYNNLLDCDLHVALFGSGYLTFYAMDELIDSLKRHESEIRTRSRNSPLLQTCITEYKDIAAVFLRELGNQTKFSMLPHIRKPTHYKKVITEINTRLNKLV